MEPWLSALAAYSIQVLAVVAVATVMQAAGRISDPALRLAWWRGVALLCLALPLLPAPEPSMGMPASVAFTPSGGAVVPAPVAPARSWLPLVGIILAGGIAYRLGWLVLGALRLRRLRRDSAPIELDPEVRALHAALAPSAEFRGSARVRQPVTFGLRRPVILVPPRVRDLPPDQQSAVACHELLHVARRDWPWIVVEEHVRALFWFHPGVWWLVEQIQISREQLVDRLVVSRLPSRRPYMSALLAFAGDGALTPSTAFLRRRHLRARLRQLTQGESAMSRTHLRWKAAALMLVTAGAAALAARVVPLELPAVWAAQAGSQLEIRLAETTPGPGLSPAQAGGANERIYLHPVPLATGGDVASVGVTEWNKTTSPRYGFGVTIAFTDAAAARVAAATSAHLGRPLAIVVDGRVVSAPVLRSSVGQWAAITGLSEQEARALAESLEPAGLQGERFNRGALPQDAVANAGRTPLVINNQPNIDPPRPIRMAQPAYTPEAMLRRIQGVVVLSAVVRADGSVHDIVVTRSLDAQNGLDEAAISSAAASTFMPGTRNGVPVDVRVTMEFRFTLPNSPPGA